jgi:hypothetical protein
MLKIDSITSHLPVTRATKCAFIARHCSSRPANRLLLTNSNIPREVTAEQSPRDQRDPAARTVFRAVDSENTSAYALAKSAKVDSCPSQVYK